jgi:hypothetical protein
MKTGIRDKNSHKPWNRLKNKNLLSLIMAFVVVVLLNVFVLNGLAIGESIVYSSKNLVLDTELKFKIFHSILWFTVSFLIFTWVLTFKISNSSKKQ